MNIHSQHSSFLRFAIISAIVVLTSGFISFNTNVESTQAGILPDIRVLDSFIDAPNTSLVDHTPNVDETGTGWIQSAETDFRIDGTPSGGASEPFLLGQPFWSVVDTLVPEYELSLKITRGVSDNTVGLLLRFVDEDN